eukprot:TRINITY_DN7220_c0_g1_i1.p1 TRINITY_DN7220_c0_g1~~TRINITY_DN7220_c0_g1_i1.p1  ORF type:complete len:112 (+),score=28.07 TRINITY_DN7220_c0_g1_i1:59-394(+)
MGGKKQPMKIASMHESPRDEEGEELFRKRPTGGRHGAAAQIIDRALKTVEGGKSKRQEDDEMVMPKLDLPEIATYLNAVGRGRRGFMAGLTTGAKLNRKGGRSGAGKLPGI